MRIHTKEFKNQIKELGREIDSRITYYNNVISSEELLSVTPVTNGNILKSAMKILEFESYIKVPINTIIKYEFGLKVNSNYEYIDYGNYIVYESEYNEDTKSYKYICYDAMLLTMKDYIELEIGTFPMTIREYLTNLCLECGLVFKNSTDIFPNYDKIIQSDLYANLGYTYRDILDELSQVTASTICVDNNDMVEVRYINNTDDVIDEEYLKDINVTFGKKYGPINSIVLSRSAESDNVYLRDEESVKNNGLCELKIVDNQIMNDNNRSDYLHDILNKLKGLEYYINDFTSTGILYYELCDRYNVKICDNNYSCILFNDEIKITQGIVEDIYTEMPNESETDYTKSDKTDKKINQAYIIVYKQNQKIEALTSEVTENSEKVASLELDVNSIKGRVSESETKIEDITTTTMTSTGTNNLYLVDAMVSNVLDYKIDGNSYQETRSGKNLLNIYKTSSSNNSSNADVFEVLQNDWIHFVNNSGAVRGYYFLEIEVESNTQYYINVEKEVTSGTPFVVWEEFDENNEKKITAYPNTSRTITTNSATKYVRVGITSSGMNTVCDYKIRLMVVKGSEAPTEYEAYGASPSPNYPSEVEVVKGYNLFDKSTITSGKYIDNSGNLVTDTSNFTGDYIPIIAEKEYVVSGSNTNYPIRIGCYDENKTFISRQLISIGSGVLTIPNNTKFVRVSCYNQVLETIQLEEGTTPRPYVPYKNIGVKTIGKNLLKFDTYQTKTPTQNWAEISANGNPFTKTGTYFYSCTGEFGTNYKLWTKDVSGKTIHNISKNNSFTITEEQLKTITRVVIVVEGLTSGTTYNGNLYPMIEEGTVATPYEPYQENITYIDLQKNNLFDKDNANLSTLIPSGGTNMKYISSDVNRSIYIPIIGGRPYTISREVITDRFSCGTSADVPKLDDKLIDFAGGVDNSNKLTINTSSNANYLCLYLSSDGTNLENQLDSIKIYEGIDIEDNWEICKVGDIKDELDLNTGILTKRIGKVVFNGTEEWVVMGATSSGANNIQLPTISHTYTATDIYYNAISDCFKYEKISRPKGHGLFNVLASGNRVWVRVNYNNSTDLGAFKTWLSNNPVTVYYVLPTPYEVQLTPTDIPLFEGINNVSLLSTLDTNTYIKYLRKTPLSDDYATNQQLNQTNENLANTDNKTSLNATEINNTNNKLNNDYYNKTQVDAMNTSTEQMITQIKNTVETNTSSTEYQISVLREQITNGITSVKTETGYTFDKDGLKIAKSDSEMNLLLDNDGMEVKRNETEVLTVRSDGVETENLKVRTYFTVGNNTRVEDYKNGTGFFFIGGAE